MPLPSRLARFNKHVTNRVARRVAGWMPGLGIVTHSGRVSGREYRTPVNVFRADEGYVFALTYGSGTDWVKNVRAAGGCTVRTRRRNIALVSPRLLVDPDRELVPGVVRWILGIVHVDEFLLLAVDPGG
jgi:deazaflavin-dependent oxidoreductase (nitroreductase family)